MALAPFWMVDCFASDDPKAAMQARLDKAFSAASQAEGSPDGMTGVSQSEAATQAFCGSLEVTPEPWS